MRFSCTKCCATASPPSSGPNSAASATHTRVKLTRGWSVGMLKVQRYSSIFTPSALAGTRNALMPRASPASPLVRANTMQCVATCMPVVHIFSPSMRQPGATVARLAAPRGLHVRGIRAVVRFGEAERQAALTRSACRG